MKAVQVGLLYFPSGSDAAAVAQSRVVGDAAELARLREDNRELRARLASLTEEREALGRALERAEGRAAVAEDIMNATTRRIADAAGRKN